MHNKKHPFRIFWFSIIASVIVGAIVANFLGLPGLWTFVVLVILEVTFSFDNAIINSKVLSKMSPFWQKMFLSVGIIVAVFGVRFILPILIVMFSVNSDFLSITNMALHNPTKYSEILHEASPIINAFGGVFLLMIGLNFFLDDKKETHWARLTERNLARFGKYEMFKIFLMLTVSLLLFYTSQKPNSGSILAAAILGILIYTTLNLFSDIFTKRQPKDTKLVGMAAFTSFIYLDVLDASFSLDGVIGAFAITTNVSLIMAGLGVGAFWVRSLTVYLVQEKTLKN